MKTFFLSTFLFGLTKVFWVVLRTGNGIATKEGWSLFNVKGLETCTADYYYIVFYDKIFKIPTQSIREYKTMIRRRQLGSNKMFQSFLFNSKVVAWKTTMKNFNFILLKFLTYKTSFEKRKLKNGRLFWQRKIPKTFWQPSKQVKVRLFARTAKKQARTLKQIT